MSENYLLLFVLSYRDVKIIAATGASDAVIPADARQTKHPAALRAFGINVRFSVFESVYAQLEPTENGGIAFDFQKRFIFRASFIHVFRQKPEDGITEKCQLRY